MLAKAEASNHWLPTGCYMSFAAYWFTIKARLNLLPVKTVLRRTGRGNGNTLCLRCRSQLESLGHVLNACTPSAGLMRARHNAILQRLVKAIPKEDKDQFMEQAFSPDNLRPDIVLRNQATGNSVVVDITVLYEAGPEAFEKACFEKEQKYSGLREWMKAQDGYT